MTDRYDELSERARWFLNNFDEIDLADICANNETAATKAQEALARVRELAGPAAGPSCTTRPSGQASCTAGPPWAPTRRPRARSSRSTCGPSR
jgi:hypothetical protein